MSLHWNQIRYRGGLLLADSLNHNENLKIIDLSWNSLGAPNRNMFNYMEKNELASEFSKIFKVPDPEENVPEWEIEEM